MTERITADLHTRWAGRQIVYREELASTNLTAKELGEADGAHGALVIADMQTAGRGRRGRTWESPKGCNLYFSLLLRPEFPIEQASMLTLVMAHSVARALPQADIKWPNDILIHGKKVCGILTELKAEKGRIQYVVIGVGINVKKQQFPEELVDKASSLEAECGEVVARETLLARIMDCFEEDYEAFVCEGNLKPFAEEYQRRLLNKDAEVKVLDPKEAFEGVARGITDTGELIVEKSDGSIVQVYAGEVSVRGVHGYI